MREKYEKYIEELKKRRKIQRRGSVFMILCSILVAAAVLWQLVLPGIAWTGTSDFDSAADVEKEEEWVSAFRDLVFTGNWGEDTAALAKTQIGYSESEENYIENDSQERKGYTRYGAWSENTYGDWDTAFAAFCLHYAGVPKEAFPIEADLEQWIEKLTEAELYDAAQEAVPQAGDLIILQKKERETEKQTGIVSEVEEREGKTYIHTIEGNCDNQVKENEYEAGDEEILGYGMLNRAQVLAEAETEDSENDTDTGKDETLQDETEKDETSQDVRRRAAVQSVLAQNEEETVNERLAVELTAGRMGSTAKSGETLYAKVVSRYSKANNPNKNVGVAIRVGELPDGVTLEGFTNGLKEVVWNDEQNQEHTIVLQSVVEDGVSYIKFEQPAGATIEFEVQFNSSNGIMGNGTAVTLEIEEEKITGLDTPLGANDVLSGPLTLKWNAKNEWDPVDKKVNRAEHNEIAVTEQNKLSGELTYTVTANSSNNENFGEIWTDYLSVTDTLTLPAGISFPAGAAVDNSRKAIIDSNGNEIFRISNMQQGGEVTNLTLNGKTVTYSLKIPNSHKENGIPVREQDNLSLEMKLNAGTLVLADGFSKKTTAEMKEEKIQNTVTVLPVPYKQYETKKTEDSVTTVPAAEPEDFILKKEADKKTVKAGDTVDYTLTFQNNGKTSVRVQDKNGTYYQVSDRLPVYLYLTREQIKALPADVQYDEANNTILWIPSRTDIEPGKTFRISFSATVKEATDEAMKNLQNGAVIRNVAQYKEKYSDSADVTYKKPELKIDKSSKDEDGDGKVSNGEKITYTIKVWNETDLNAVMDGVITDILPKGLIFESADIGISKNIKTSGNYIYHYGTSSEVDHTVKFEVEGQKLTWNVGIVHAHETLTLTYVCTANVDQLENKTQIWNTASLSSGGSDSDYVGVDYPIHLEKKVAQDTNATYPDKTVFDYTISVQNDLEHPSEKENLELVDQLPSGMIPVGCTLVQHQVKNNVKTDKEISWEDYAADNYDKEGSSTFTAVIGGREANVRKSVGIKLIWNLGKLKAGEKVTIAYRAQIILTEAQKQEGGRYDFTNRAYVDGISKDVTVHGGKAIGHLYLEKMFDGKTIWNNATLTEEQKKITFELTGVDAEGKTIIFRDGTLKQTVTLGEFNNVNANGRLSHVFRNLPVGTYTVKEINAEVEGKILSTTYQVDGGQTVTGSFGQAEIKSQEQTNVIVNNVYKTGPSADLQKSVWALKEETKGSNGQTVWSDLSDKRLFAVHSEDTVVQNVVIYNVTAINTGSEPLHLDTLLDELPQELEYVGMCNNSWNPKENWNPNQYFKQEISTLTWGNLNAYEGGKLVEGVKVNSAFDKSRNEVTFSFNQATGGYDLESGKAVTFLMLCRVKQAVKLGKPITNTLKLSVDENVDYRDYDEIKTTHTPYDQNQNNGGSEDLGVTDGKRTIASSVTVIPENTIVPGIAKKAVSYIVPGKTEEYPLTEESNIQPDSTVKWEITLYNDGTEALEDYRVEDAVTPSFHLMTRTEAEKKEISSPYQLKIFNSTGARLNTFDVSEQVWKTIQGELVVSGHVFEFGGSEYAIPAGGYARLTVYTNNTVANYKMYKNTAVLIPSSPFNANEVRHGELKKDSEGKYIGVAASDEVNALGDYASVSWKTITEKENGTNTARGTQDKNYISVGLESEYVTYTNNIRNISGKKFGQFTVIDLLPGNNDTGVINQEDIRGSEFTVSFAGGLSVYVLDGGEKKNVSGCTVEFSSKTGFTQNDFDGTEGKEWHEEWQAKDRSFRICLPENFVLTPYQTLVVEYDGKLGADAKPGAIAWNSFGYQYYSQDHSTPMKAEPPKVGVMIPKVPSIQKEVVDSTGKVQEYDAGKVFTFELYEQGTVGKKKLCEFTLCQGGYMELSGLTDEAGNRVIMENGKEYVIAESTDNMPEGYELVGIGEKGGALEKDFAFTYYDSKDIVIYARNKVDTYRYELPETGGIGTSVYTVGGVLLILAASLLYGYRVKRKKEGRA